MHHENAYKHAHAEEKNVCISGVLTIDWKLNPRLASSYAAVRNSS